MQKIRKMSLATKTLLAMLIGAVVGFLVGPKIEVIQFIGDIFLNILQMAIVPLIFFTVVTAISSMGDVKKLGLIGTKLIFLFIGTTVASSTIGLLVGKMISPGKGLILKNLPPVQGVQQPPTFSGVVTGMFPKNIIQSMAEANMLQVIVFAIFSGIAILLLKESDRNRINDFFGTMNRFILKILHIVLELSPYGVFALMAVTAGEYGTSVMGPLTKFIGTIYLGLFLHLLLVYFLLYFLFTRKNPFVFFKKISPVWITSLTTCSTKATMPISMQTLEERLGVPKDVVGITIPLGASMNMDGNGLWFGVVAVFVSQLAGVHMSFSEQIMAILLGVLMTLGSPGIPGGIFVATTVFLTTIGLPIQVIGLLAGIFRLMDMGLTTVNVIGSVVVAAILGRKKEGNIIGKEQGFTSSNN